MITTNYSANNQPTFGQFRFTNGAKKLIQKRTDTPEVLKELNDIISKEAKRTDRNIDISRFCSRLFAKINGGKSIRQRKLPDVYIDGTSIDVRFLREMSRGADRIEERNLFRKQVNEELNKIMK